MTTTETIVRFCEYDPCDDALVRYSGESQRRFAARRYCTHEHSAAARRKPTTPAKPKQPNLGLNASPPPFVPRIENGVWRPNAAGWPAQPRIPVRNR
jgi:hypothetical protein